MHDNWRHLYSLLFVALLFSGCDGAEEVSRLANPEVSFSSTHASCKGDRQSPINLTNAPTPAQGTLLKTTYRTAQAIPETSDDGTHILFEDGTLTIEETTYRLDRMEVRAPSEHTIGGDRFAAEIQLVHRAGDQEIAILSIPVTEGTGPNDDLDKWLEHSGSSFSYNVGRLLPSRRSYYRYDGSLTRPPCSETVRWLVMDTPLEASNEQVRRLNSDYAAPARPLQSRNRRKIVHVAP